FGIKEFHGEEYSADPAEVDPQNLGLNDVMGFHQIVESCAPDIVESNDPITARVTYRDPDTGADEEDFYTVLMSDAVKADATALHKSDVIVSYAKALIVIDDFLDGGDETTARQTALAMK